MKCDVLVVGAGPAGSCTASGIAEAGFDVLAIDRREEVGRPVQCGEFLPTPDELKRILPGSEDFDGLFDIEKSLVEREISNLEFLGPAGIKFDLEFKGLTLDRMRFDQSLWKRAEKAGARIVLKTELQSVGPGGIAKTSGGDIEFKVIVGADGPTSRVRKSFGLSEPKSLSTAMSGQAKGDFDDVVRMYFGTIAPGGYAWIIPKKGRANVGLGIQKKFTDEPLTKLFDSFLSGFELKAEDIGYKPIPISGPLRKTSAGNAILVGDAAGHVMATNGGGIPIAMICGRIAGRAVARHLKDGAELSEYDREWKRQLWTPLANAARTKAAADLFFKSDGRLKFAMNLLGKKGLERAILCRRLFHLF